tara:strand:- start:157 stop:423 length:267 start_codon:yes stop_codon:yes gene_type:complete
MDIEKKKYEQAKSDFRNLLQEVKDFLEEDSSGEFPGSAAPEPGPLPTKGETPAKVEEAKQKEYFDSLKEERSRVLIKHLMEAQQQKPQ